MEVRAKRRLLIIATIPNELVQILQCLATSRPAGTFAALSACLSSVTFLVMARSKSCEKGGRMQSLKKSYYLISLALALLSIYLGLGFGEPLRTFFTSLGSAVLGTVIAAYFASVTQTDVVSSIFEKLSDRQGIQSNESDIAWYRQVFHHYHMTQSGGEKVWHYRKLDFTHEISSGHLTASVKAADARGSFHTYKMAAGLRDERFIIIGKHNGSREPTVVEVYPHIGTATYGVYAGLGFIQSWDGSNLITPCLLSLTSLIGGVDEGALITIPGSKERLEKAWHEETSRHRDILLVMPEANSGSPKGLVGQIGRVIWIPEQQRKTMAISADAE
jgi:hypothetical protein